MTAIRRDSGSEEVPGQSLTTVDPDSVPWSVTDLLLAALVDELRVSNYLFVKANKGKDGPDPPTPHQIPRPGVAKPAKKPELTRRQRMSIDPRAKQQRGGAV